jgi:3-hydroxymyristoyl/3-hydroxydecanoyl-(acyl carrier protein) dehydratase
MAIDNAKFRRPVLPGDQLIFDLEMVRFKGSICKMTGRCFVRGQLVAEADLMSIVVDR